MTHAIRKPPACQSRWGFTVAAAIGLCLIMACSPAATSTPGSGVSASASAASGGSAGQPSARTLVVAVRNEPATLAAAPLGGQGGGAAVYFSKRIFNADLGILDPQGNPQPYLADALPQLNTDTWQVFPDGRMQTTYHLRPNETWHDGTPLTSGDFVFAWQVYSTPAFGTSDIAPYTLIDDVEAPDPATIVINWKQPYAQADTLQSIGTGAVGLPPLPQDQLQSVFDPNQPEQLVNSTFWTQGYIGAGPYRLDQWQPGTFYDASAFQGHVLGVPKIAHIHVQFMSDGNTVLASMVSGDVQLATDVALPLGYVPQLLNTWGQGHGTAILHPNQWRAAYIQMRANLQSYAPMLDPRVRKALAYAVDKDAVNNGAWDGQAIPADTWIAPGTDEGRAVDAAITKYPLDLQMSAQLMSDAGFTKGADGIYTSPTAGRFSTQLNTNTSPNNEQEISILADSWHNAGFDVQESVYGAALQEDNEARASFPGIFTSSSNVGESVATAMNTTNIASPQNRWTGGNRNGYSDADFDHAVNQLGVTLDRSQRTQIVVQMATIFNDDEPAISLEFQPQPWVFPAALTGPMLVSSDTNMAWNIQEWQFS